jgi:outer membrane receptor protein involved in Fe transport
VAGRASGGLRARGHRLLPAALAAAIAAGAVAPAFAAPFSARLLLPDGEPAAGYVVSVVGTTLSTVCAADGSFVFDPAPQPPFTLVAAGRSGELSAPIEVAALDAALPVELQLPPAVRDSVTVVSGVAPSLELLPASAATVVSAEAIEQRPPQRVVDTLAVVAGASKLGEGADSVPALRNLGRGRTLILLDGARVSAERRAGPSATFVDPASLASVEVLRGPGSVVYGSDAFGGVLNIVTRDPERGVRAGEFQVEGWRGGQQQVGGAASVSLPAAGGDVALEAHAADADDAEAGDGRPIDNSAFESKGASVRYLRPAGAGRLRASLQIDRVDDLGKAAIDSDAIRAVYPLEDSDRLTLGWIGAGPGSWDALEASLFYGTYEIVLDRDRAATETSNRRIDRSDTRAEDAQARALLGREAGGGRLQVGLDLYGRIDLRAKVGRVDYAADALTVERTTVTSAIEDASQRAYGLFATWSRPLAPSWTLGLGARGDRIDSENRGGFFGDRSESADALSGNLSLTWADAGWSVTGQAARGFRVPTLSDRYFRGPSGRGFVVGNPELDPESSFQLDLAVRRSFGQSAVGLYVYRYEIEDLIERYQEGSDFFFRNRGEAKIEGVELELQSRFLDHWAFEGGAAWSDGATDGGAEIDDVAAPNLFAGVRYADRWGYAFARATLVDDQDDPGPTELARDGYALLELGAGWQLHPAVELRLTVKNALDEAYTGAADDAADRSPGRAIGLALAGRFGGAAD